MQVYQSPSARDRHTMDTPSAVVGHHGQGTNVHIHMHFQMRLVLKFIEFATAAALALFTVHNVPVQKLNMYGNSSC